MLDLLTIEHDHVGRSNFALCQIHNITLLDFGPIKALEVFLSAINFNFSFVDFLVRLATDIVEVYSLRD